MDTILVIALILQLGSPVYAERETAHSTLSTLPWTAAPWFRHGADHFAKVDTEVSVRCDKLWREACWKKSGQIKPANWPYVPWVDSLPYDYPSRYLTIEAYLDAVGCSLSGGGDTPPHWPKYRKATRLMIYYLLVEGWPECKVANLLDDMVAHEKRWIKKHKYAFNFPKEMLEAVGE